MELKTVCATFVLSDLLISLFEMKYFYYIRTLQQC